MKDHLRRCSSRLVVKLSILALSAALIASVMAQPISRESNPLVLQHITARYPAGSIATVDTADAALAEVARERALIEARFAADDQACQPRFFVTACIDEAKERRHQALKQLRPIEVEANSVKRQARVAERDQAAERKRLQAQDRDLAAIESGSTEREPPDETAATTAPVIAPIISNAVSRERKRERTKEELALDAKKRAENIAAYERKVEMARARQDELEKRRIEKEEKRRAKQISSSDTTPNISRK